MKTANCLYFCREIPPIAESLIWKSELRGFSVGTDAHDLLANYTQKVLGIQIPRGDYPLFYLNRRQSHKIGKAMYTQIEEHYACMDTFKTKILDPLGETPSHSSYYFHLLRSFFLHGDGVYMQRLHGGAHPNYVSSNDWDILTTEEVQKIQWNIEVDKGGYPPFARISDESKATCG